MTLSFKKTTSITLLAISTSLSGCTIYPVVGAYYIEDKEIDKSNNPAQEVVTLGAAGKEQVVSGASNTELNPAAIENSDIITGSIPGSETDKIALEDNDAFTNAPTDEQIKSPDYDFNSLSEIIMLDNPALIGENFTTGSVSNSAPMVTGSPQSTNRANDINGEDEGTTWELRMKLNR